MGIISGTITLPNGQPAANRVITFVPIRQGVKSGNVMTEPVQVMTSNSGAVSQYIAAGVYTVVTEWGGSFTTEIDDGAQSWASIVPVEIHGPFVDAVEFKVGDDISLAAQAVDKYGRAVDFTDVSISASAMSMQGVKYPFAVSIDSLPERGRYLISIGSDVTSGWTPGVFKCDVKMSSNGEVAHSDTFKMVVAKSITE